MPEHNQERRHNPRHNNGHRPRNGHNQRPNYGSDERKKHNIRGHDAALHHFVRSGDEVIILLNNPLKLPRSVHESHSVSGKMTQYDAYTVTLEVSSLTSPLILFKSNIGGMTKAIR